MKSSQEYLHSVFAANKRDREIQVTSGDFTTENGTYEYSARRNGDHWQVDIIPMGGIMAPETGDGRPVLYTNRGRLTVMVPNKADIHRSAVQRALEEEQK